MTEKLSFNNESIYLVEGKNVNRTDAAGKNEPSGQEILAKFTPEQQEEIRYKQRVLSSLAYFIGKDFAIPVELNQPGAGWHWDFKDNIIRIDPQTLLESPIGELRYLICHEGGHRRISRMNFIPLEEWRQSGFSAMMNFIEDPRNDNFVEESYPRYGENVDAAWNKFFEKRKQETEGLAKEKLGIIPRFAQAGYEYIRHWFEERKGKKIEIDQALPEEVKSVVGSTLDFARDSWFRYPSREEADGSEELIKKYAEISYVINREQVWPEFKKLIDKDIEDQKIQESFKDMQKPESGKESAPNIPDDLKEKLTPEEKQSLEDAIKQALEQGQKGKLGDKNKGGSTEGGGEGEETENDVEADQLTLGEGSGGKPIDLDTLSDELKQKIKEFIESLPKEKQQELKDRAEKTLKEFEKSLDEELEGKLAEDPEQRQEREEREGKDKDQPPQQAQISAGETVRGGKLSAPVDFEGLKIYKERVERLVNKDANVYEKYRREVLPLIEQLESDLREIFIDRQATSWKGGFRLGKRIDIKSRIQEKAKMVPAMESKSWQKRELPDKNDYGMSVLVDLSGSMRKGNKIEETFKAVVVLAEVLNRLGLNVEILGFNDALYEYQKFGEGMSKDIREHLGGMFKEVADSCCTSCGNEHNETDLGWATKMAGERLAKQKSKHKFIFTLSDCKLEESSNHPRDQYPLNKMIEEVLKDTGATMIGLGVGQGTGDIKQYYPNSAGNIDAKQMAENLAELIKRAIANYEGV
jgi:hypothetical protein